MSSLLPWNSAPGRSIDIELGGQEVINIELDALDSSADDVIEVLRDGQPKVGYWTRLAGEYLRRGYLDAAEKIALAAVESFQSSGSIASLPPVYSLLANVQLARARRAPKMKLSNARQDAMTHEKSRDEYMMEATLHLNSCEKAIAEESGRPSTLLMLTRAIHQLASRSMDESLRTFEAVLLEYPTNLVALMGKARILYARRQFASALKIFQQILQLNPYCLPDPRIGIGLCLWAMNHKERAKAAWQRSVEVNPSEWSGQLLLGLEALNSSRDPNLTDEERTYEIRTGSKLIERAFNSNQRNAAAANALCDIFLRKGQHKRALKLAERTIQFADTLTILTDGYIHAGRVCHAEGSIVDATKHYTAAANGQPKHVLAAIGLAQMQMRNDEFAAAIHTLDTLLQAPNPQRSLEATVMLASLRAYPRPGVSSSDVAQEKSRARDLFDRIYKAIEQQEEAASRLNGHAKGLIPVSRTIVDDMEMHIEVARLWQNESIDRPTKSFQEALRISEADVTTTRRGRCMRKHSTGASSLSSDSAEAMSTSILYNLARIYEDIGESTMATEAYEKLLARHPEYVDAKIRQAQMLSELNRFTEAHELLKQALSSQTNNLNIRAFYTYFLIQANMPKLVKEFVFTTLKDHDKNDIYSLCAAGWFHYYQARESRDTKAVEDRKRNFQRSAEFYERALILDPFCAVAAQGLAIVTAEDALGTLGGTLPGPVPDDPQRRLVNAQEAVDVFAKVRESTIDGSVYVNMGHCYYSRDEYDRAIECYETASRRYYDNHDSSVLLYLCRSWYAKANKDQSFAAMSSALSYAQKALHIQPHDKVVLYNIAMIEQKAAEMLFALPSAKRTLKDMQRAIEHAGHAQKLFASLAADSSPVLPYNREIADQRRKYGDSMLRRADEHLAVQRQYETERHARLEAARQMRQEEKEKAEEEARQREELARKAAEELAQQRRIAISQAQEWTREVKAESDDERERKAAKKASKKVKSEAASGDEGAANGEPKRKRVRKGKKASGAVEESDADDDALFTGDEADKPAKKRTKKRVIRDDDEEEHAVSAPRKKQFKSKEIISDSDEEMT
ncbi:hypothetical protein EW146_g5490 [Bondarzewia mesenterica]|uniref:Uncharacterized protein n=1 Tax=Bondarzewia mesenterica TaxID=1095465 RepID=A0A4S4LRA6_9AGAM|nr:hypothetical protein EW146_g5490 [Bondarzewia mesenterica]